MKKLKKKNNQLNTVLKNTYNFYKVEDEVKI